MGKGALEMTEKELEKGFEEYESYYNKMLDLVYSKLDNLTSYEIKRVGGERIYYSKERPKIYTVYEVNKRINELQKLKNEMQN